MQVDDTGGEHRRADRVGAGERRLIHPDRSHCLDAIRVLDHRGAVLDDRGHHRGPAHPEIAGHRGHRMPVAPDPPARLLAGTLRPRRPRPDLPMRFGPGLPLTLRVHTTPDSFDPHQRHRPIPGRQIPHPSRAAIMQPRLRTAGRAPARRRGRFDGVLDLAVTLGHRQHSHAFQPEHRRSTTVLNHLGPSRSCSYRHES